MAKSAAKITGPSRVRFIMLDAELNEGDLAPFTLAIQNALRPATSATPRALAQRMAGQNEEVADPAAIPPSVPEDGTHGEQETSESPIVQTKPPGIRKLRVPKVLEIDVDSGVSFVSFAQAKNSSSDFMKYLIVAAWFKEHRKLDAITADHVYTCFRAAGWPTAIADFSAPLRGLKAQQLMTQAGRGEYAINHLGLAKVNKTPG